MGTGGEIGISGGRTGSGGEMGTGGTTLEIIGGMTGSAGKDGGSDTDAVVCCPPDPQPSGCTHLGGAAVNGTCGYALRFLGLEPLAHRDRCLRLPGMALRLHRRLLTGRSSAQDVLRRRPLRQDTRY